LITTRRKGVGVGGKKEHESRRWAELNERKRNGGEEKGMTLRSKLKRRNNLAKQ